MALGLTFLSTLSVLAAADCALPATSPGVAPAFVRPYKGRLYSGFGLRHHPLLNIAKFHTGVDFRGPPGDAVHAAAPGRVVEARYKGQNGKWVVIDHGGGWQTTYSHLSSFAVAEGACVAAGDPIAAVGSTGLSSEPHLHFEVISAGRAIDPAPLLGVSGE